MCEGCMYYVNQSCERLNKEGIMECWMAYGSGEY